jgi:hypothetical protein
MRRIQSITEVLIGRESVDCDYRVVVSRSKLENPERMELLPRCFFVSPEPKP